ncbi:predicted protein [Listeria monocytogenes FSL J2-071]|nr:predicted protein [Listeria monocytogenes FSL J2-071]
MLNSLVLHFLSKFPMAHFIKKNPAAHLEATGFLYLMACFLLSFFKFAPFFYCLIFSNPFFQSGV